MDDIDRPTTITRVADGHRWGKVKIIYLIFESMNNLFQK